MTNTRLLAFYMLGLRFKAHLVFSSSYLPFLDQYFPLRKVEIMDDIPTHEAMLSSQCWPHTKLPQKQFLKIGALSRAIEDVAMGWGCFRMGETFLLSR